MNLRNFANSFQQFPPPFQFFRQRKPSRLPFSTALRKNDLKYFKDRRPLITPKFKIYLGLAVFGISTYYIANLEKVPLSGRTRFNNISPSQEVEMSRISEREILAQYRSSILPSSHPYSVLIAKVAKRILKVTGS